MQKPTRVITIKRLSDHLKTFFSAEYAVHTRVCAILVFPLLFPLPKSYTVGAAIKMDKNVPTIIPVRIANDNPRISSLPKMNKAVNMKMMFSHVIILRFSVELIA